MGDQVFCKEKKNAKVKAEFVTHNPLLKWQLFTVQMVSPLTTALWHEFRLLKHSLNAQTLEPKSTLMSFCTKAYKYNNNTKAKLI